MSFLNGLQPKSNSLAIVIHHPGRRFWVVETMPDHRRPAWPNILAQYSL